MNTRTLLKNAALQAVLCALVLAGAATGLWAGDKDGTIKIGAYNMEWFVEDPPGPHVELPPRVKPKNPQDIEKVASCIRAMDADVVTFEEVQSEAVIRSMLAHHLNDMKYQYVAVDQTNSTSGQNIGVMSRKPITSITSYRYTELTLPEDDRTWLFSRDLLKVTIQATPEKTMDVYVVHLKSKRDAHGDKHSDAHRLAEMLAVKKIIGQELEKDPAAWVVLAGDFNDTPESAPLRAVLAKDATTGKALLTDPHAGIPAEKRITYLHEPYRSTIDFTLLSPGLVTCVVPGKMGVLANEIKDPKMLEGSDHSPVYVTLDLTQKK